MYACEWHEECNAFATGPDRLCDHHRAEQLRVRAEDLAMWQWVDESEDDLAALSAWGDVAGSYELGAEYTPAGVELAERLDTRAPRPMTVRDPDLSLWRDPPPLDLDETDQ